VTLPSSMRTGDEYSVLMNRFCSMIRTNLVGAIWLASAFHLIFRSSFEISVSSNSIGI